MFGWVKDGFGFVWLLSGGIALIWLQFHFLCLYWGRMCPPAASPLPDIDISSTYEEFFGSLEKMNKGYPLPSNVINDVDPYSLMPSNLPDGLWFLVPYKDKTITQNGHWKAKGEAYEIFSNSVITGWRTTLEFYEGQNQHERKTDWVMQEFRITQKKWCESKKAEVFC
ncbi:hypothetical protein Pint_08911 [Pistacia integerrima]|uniref:Uncharacterized protein n=1 Tax=Pistacia integerrima TaxID=434235 RepID=A0ACC0XW09_9ROSI|nr:hypothetical protein Pint_08911 [Pistacia integerrima]